MLLYPPSLFMHAVYVCENIWRPRAYLDIVVNLDIDIALTNSTITGPIGVYCKLGLFRTRQKYFFFDLSSVTITIWRNVESTLAIFLFHWANFHCCTWPFWKCGRMFVLPHLPNLRMSWSVVVPQLTEHSLPIPEVCGSNPAIGKIYIDQCFLSTASKDENK